MNIWHVTNREFTSLLLWRTSENSFRIIQDGWYAPVLTNSPYTLIDKMYAELFSQYPDQLIYWPVRIHDYSLKTENKNYVELKIKNSISPSLIAGVDSSGKKMWAYGGYLFVSEDLKNEMIALGDTNLSFEEGFSHFCQ